MKDRLRLRGISVHIGDRRVLDDVDLGVSPGEVISVLGPNGAGKTSLLRVIAGHLDPDRGTVELDGKPSAAFTRLQWARRVGVVPQHHSLPAGFTVAELVHMGRYPYRGLFGRVSTQDDDAVRGAMAALHIDRLGSRPVQELSGGERQMVVLAMALAQQPRLLLLDEPTTHLDMAHETRIMDALQRARRRFGLSALVVLHDLRLAEQHGDRMVLLRDGRVVAEGEPASVRGADLAACFGVDVEVARFHRGRRRRGEVAG